MKPGEPVYASEPVEGFRGAYRDTPSGITAVSLAAYLELRPQIVPHLPPLEVKGTGAEGRPLTLVSIAVNDLSLVVSGFNWGYGGEGPRGLALALWDLGFFSTTEEALQFVRDHPRAESWVLRR